MRLPARTLRYTAVILTLTTGTNAHGEEVPDWTAGESVRCALYPAGGRAVYRAQLLGKTVTKEAYLDTFADLDPVQNRLRIDGTDYAIQDAQPWPGFTQALLQEAGQ